MKNAIEEPRKKYPTEFYSSRKNTGPYGYHVNMVDFTAEIVGNFADEVDWMKKIQDEATMAADNGNHYITIDPEQIGRKNWRKVQKDLVDRGFEVDYEPEVNLYKAIIHW